MKKKNFLIFLFPMIFFSQFTIKERFQSVYKDRVWWLKEEEFNNQNKIKSEEVGLGKYEESIQSVVNFNSDDFDFLIGEEVKEEDKPLYDYFLCHIEKYKGKPVLDFYKEAPFIIVEHYFYYDLLRRYIKHLYPDRTETEKITDLFLEEKKDSIEKHKEEIEFFINFYYFILHSRTVKGYNSEERNNFLKAILEIFFEYCLYGNTTDLSQNEQKSKKFQNPDILIDKRKNLINYLYQEKIKREKGETPEFVIDMIIDNSGVELICDIILAICLLDEKLATKVNLHVNRFPIFVSDTFINTNYAIDDGQFLLSSLQKINDKVHAEVCKYFADNKLEWKEDLYWNMPTPFEGAPDKIKESVFDRSGLIIFKGDLNYRRLVQDLKYKRKTNPFKKTHIVDYIKQPYVIIRTLKSNLFLDYLPKDNFLFNDLWEKQNYLKEQLRTNKITLKEMTEESWKTNGEKGVINFVPKTDKKNKSDKFGKNDIIRN